MPLRVYFVSLLIFSTLLAQSAIAITSLPYSTYGSQNGWNGYKTYKQDGFDVVLYFNVYDVLAYPTQFNWQGDVEMPASDRYIYAYEVVNTSNSSIDISFFSILGFDGELINQELMHSTCSQEDGFGAGIAPDPQVSDDDEQGSWAWSAEGGYLTVNSRSWILMFTSAWAPTVGSFKIEPPGETEPPVPGDEDIPEPGTIALFGLAYGLCVKRRTRKRPKT